MLALRDAVPRRMPLHWAEFATLRQKLLKIGARVVEKAARVRIHLPRRRPVPHVGGAARRLRTLTAGAGVPQEPEPVQPPNLDFQDLRSRRPKGAEQKTLRARNQPIKSAYDE